MNTKTLAADILNYVHTSTAGAIDRYLPDLRVPGFFIGHRISQDFAVDLCVVLTLLHKAGYTTVGRGRIDDVIRTIFSQLDGKTIKVFYSYRVAETLQAFGGLGDNVLLHGLPADQIQQLKNATDSTDIYDPKNDALKNYPNNYWCVLARCEHARSQLGLVTDDSIYRRTLAMSRDLLFRNPAGFFDDDVAGRGRYDIYTADAVLFVEPMWDLLGREKILKLVADHLRLLESIAMPNGASVCWGRSIGALSVVMTAELATAGLHNHLGNPPRLLHLAANAFDHFKSDWMRDDLINGHRARMTDAYRGPARLMQMTFDCLQKWAWAALQLREMDQTHEPLTRGQLFPPRDELIRFESRPAGVWTYRDRVMEFQLPVVCGYTGDYVTAPHAPGLFDMPVDSPILIGVPRAVVGGKEFSTMALPASLQHAAGSLSIAGQPVAQVGTKDESLPATVGTRAATWTVKNGSLVIDEQWTFDTLPAALSFMIAECDVPLTVQWSTASHFAASKVDVNQMHGFDTAWGMIKHVHQINVKPESTVSLRVTITPAIKVVQVPAKHDYNRGMYDRMPAGAVVEVPFENGIALAQIDSFIEQTERAGLLHVGWPEHLLAWSVPKNELVNIHANLVGELRRRGAKIVWTMHNRRPHAWPAQDGRDLYRVWAPAADALLHHSGWGKSIMLADYPFREDCLHATVPHGHFGRQMKTHLTRTQLEEKYKLTPCAMRFGVLGRYQPEKQIELMLEAFHRAGRSDQQLLLSAYDDHTVIPNDPRIIKLPRKAWLTRDEIAEHNHLCDGLLAAQTGDTYLTSGMVADGVGVGSAMVVPEWEFYREIIGDAGLYHANTVDSLAKLLANVTDKQIAACRVQSQKLQPAYDWTNLSPKVLDIFRTLVTK